MENREKIIVELLAWFSVITLITAFIIIMNN
jgi:hypothetical protein